VGIGDRATETRYRLAESERDHQGQYRCSRIAPPWLEAQRDLMLRPIVVVDKSANKAGACTRVKKQRIFLCWFTTNLRRGDTKNPRRSGQSHAGRLIRWRGAAVNTEIIRNKSRQRHDIAARCRYPAYCAASGLRPTVGRVRGRTTRRCPNALSGPQILCRIRPVARTIGESQDRDRADVRLRRARSLVGRRCFEGPVIAMRAAFVSGDPRGLRRRRG